MHVPVNPKSVDASMLGQPIGDPTGPEGLQFYHGESAKPLATPWQVAAHRAELLKSLELPPGVVLDPACGSGVQLAAHAALLNRPVIGIELEESRAHASASNVMIIAQHRNEQESARLNATRILVGDGLQSEQALASWAESTGSSNQYSDVMSPIGLLQLDPARPRNSRTHALSEMAPPLDKVFSAWAPYLSHAARGPALLLDLSPRLVHQQRLDVEQMVDAVWPGIERTWVWTSRGGGRVDRLALWLGSASTKGVARRFTRLPSRIGQPSLSIEGSRPLVLGEDKPTAQRHPPRKGEFVSIIDSALLESGLVENWLDKVLPADSDRRWGVVEGRRPQLHHSKPLVLKDAMDSTLVQASGKIVALAHMELTLDNLDNLVEQAVANDIGKLAIRCVVDPALQPKIQGSLDRQLSRRSGKRVAFIAQQPGDSMILLCVE